MENLERKVEILEKRIEILEQTERRRKAFRLTRFVVKVIIIAIVGVLLWKGYDYIINHLPDYINDQIGNFIPILGK